MLMNHLENNEIECALRAISDMISRSERAQAKFAVGSPQHTLQVNRIHALRMAHSLVLHARDEAVALPEITELERAKAPLASLISKSEKAQGKLDENSWQFKMLRDNLSALRLASKLLERALCGALL